MAREQNTPRSPCPSVYNKTMLKIPQKLLDQIHEHLEAAYPEEGVGFLIGKGEDSRQVIALYPVENASPKEVRSTRYDVAPKDIIEADEKAEAMGLELIGAFHSHPDHPEKPSETDLKLAQPHFSYMISSIIKGKAISTRSWLLEEDRKGFREEEIEKI